MKVDSVNPVLASGDLTFLCPILNEEVAWEAKDVFNPAAVVKDGKINLLYRAEDFLGKNNGTSRIGLARSEDGLQFEKRSSPVFYPEKDYEIEGQINHVCFIEGMVPYKGNWFLYYGTADSKIAVSVCKL